MFGVICSVMFYVQTLFAQNKKTRKASHTSNQDWACISLYQTRGGDKLGHASIVVLVFFLDLPHKKVMSIYTMPMDKQYDHRTNLSANIGHKTGTTFNMINLDFSDVVSNVAILHKIKGSGLQEKFLSTFVLFLNSFFFC